MKTSTFVAFLLVGALCWTCTVASDDKKREEKVDQQEDDADRVLEKILMKMLVNEQDTDAVEKEDDGLAELQESDEEDDIMKQDDNDEQDEAAEQHSVYKPGCYGRRCSFPTYKVKLFGRQLLSFGIKAKALGVRILLVSKALKKLSFNLGSYGLQLKRLGVSLSVIGKKLLSFRSGY